MKRLLFFGFLSVLLAFAGSVCAENDTTNLEANAETPAAAAESEPTLGETPEVDESKCTVITSERLSYDKEKHVAVFEDNVVVVDPQIKIMSDLLRVIFDDEDQVASIEAEGSVRMAQEDKIATSSRAKYDVGDGKVVLTGNPKVRRGKHEISGDTITFWRNDNRMLVEPNARVRIILEKDEKDENKGFLGGPLN